MLTIKSVLIALALVLTATHLAPAAASAAPLPTTSAQAVAAPSGLGKLIGAVIGGVLRFFATLLEGTIGRILVRIGLRAGAAAVQCGSGNPGLAGSTCR